MKKLLIIFLGISILNTTGCLTQSVWNEHPTMESKSTEVVKLTDDIVTAFEYKNIKVQSKEAGSNVKSIKIPESGFGFVGKKYVYILTSGSVELMELNELVKTVPLAAFDNPKGIIRIGLTPQKENQKLIEFKQDYFVYTDPKFNFTEEQIKSLEQAKFNKHPIEGNKFSWSKTIIVKGYVIGRKDINLPLISDNKLNESYQVELYAKESNESFSAGNLAVKVITTPFTLVGDIIITPAMMAAAMIAAMRW